MEEVDAACDVRVAFESLFAIMLAVAGLTVDDGDDDEDDDKKEGVDVVPATAAAAAARAARLCSLASATEVIWAFPQTW